jgi:hypothetical protein
VDAVTLSWHENRFKNCTPKPYKVTLGIWCQLDFGLKKSQTALSQRIKVSFCHFSCKICDFALLIYRVGVAYVEAEAIPAMYLEAIPALQS